MRHASDRGDKRLVQVTSDEIRQASYDEGRSRNMRPKFTPKFPVTAFLDIYSDVRVNQETEAERIKRPFSALPDTQ